MIFFPAIDIKGGNCVRLIKGNMNQATIFNNDPSLQAKSFERLGSQWLHIVDLDGAFSGESSNKEVVTEIVGSINIPIQLGGGIRSLPVIDYWLSNGVERVVLGTIAIQDPEFVTHACRLYPGRIAVGIDVKDGKVAIEGWDKISNISALELALRYQDAGVAAIIHTDISRDGTMLGANLDATLDLSEEVNIPIILSGGIASMVDLKEVIQKVATTDCKLMGIISGRAVYEGKIDVAEATQLCSRF